MVFLRYFAQVTDFLNGMEVFSEKPWHFLIISFVIFLLIKVINTMKKKEKPAPAAPAGPTQEELLAEIRDLLKNKS